MTTGAEMSKNAALEDKKEEPISKSLKKHTPTQELPKALTSPSQMKQTKGV
jgi:hypothetical protein